jgi:hypothetical protein
MMSLSTVAIAVLLLGLGVTSLALAAVTGRFSVRGGRRRGGALAVLGVAALVGMVLLLSGEGWSAIRGDLLWPLAVHLLAMLAGIGAGAFLLYNIVGAR